ncbi:MAG: NAD(P)/FAD-dependent oxidoreductase [Desulfurococcales archaeon]|nr:NAD(P)/FAD-dependent oxidoreductase [Desulfurococcales archaeon]
MSGSLDGRKYDVLVIGAGMGGGAIALRAKQLGLKAAIVEKARLGGTCVTVGCVPTKYLLRVSEHARDTMNMMDSGIVMGENVSFDVKSVMKRKEELLEQVIWWYRDVVFPSYEIDVIRGEARITSPHTVKVNGETIEVKYIGVATGSIPVAPPIQGLKEAFDKGCAVFSDQALSMTEAPDHIIVIGGGPIGLELATVWEGFGSKITVVELLERLLPMMDKDLSKAITDILLQRGYNIHTSTKVTRIDPETCEVYLSSGERIRGDKILVSTGRKPRSSGLGLEEIGVKIGEDGRIIVNERMQTSVPNIYAVGDVTGPPLLASKAKVQGIVAAENMAGITSTYNPKLVPFAVFTDPEVASVGVSAYKGDPEYVVKKFPAGVNYRSIVYERPFGLAKVVFNKEGVLVGFHMIGLHASEVVNAATMAIQKGYEMDDVMETIFAHPVMSEVFLDAMHLANGVNVYLPKR